MGKDTNGSEKLFRREQERQRAKLATDPELPPAPSAKKRIVARRAALKYKQPCIKFMVAARVQQLLVSRQQDKHLLPTTEGFC